MSVYIKSFDDITSSETIGFLKKMSEAFAFDNLSIDFLDGMSYSTDGIELNTAQDEFIQSVKSGKVFITDVTKSKFDDTPIVRIQVPIHKDGLPVASLGLSLKREYLNHVLKPILSGNNKFFYLIDKYGEYIAFDSGGNSIF